MNSVITAPFRRLVPVFLLIFTQNALAGPPSPNPKNLSISGTSPNSLSLAWQSAAVLRTDLKSLTMRERRTQPVNVRRVPS